MECDRFLSTVRGPRELVDAVLSRSTSRRSRLHGDEHARAVANAGLAIAAETPGADPGLVLLFALLHDSMRRRDHGDSGHGKRAARFVHDLSDEGVLVLMPPDRELLETACRDHSSSATAHDPTLAACWDANRLNVWRLGIEPDPAFLSTQEARRPERIQWAKTSLDAVPSWGELLGVEARASS